MEDVRHKGVLDAKLTGQKVYTSAHFLLECSCPSCNGKQYHPQGQAECIYCGDHMRVNQFQIVPKTASENESGNLAGPSQTA